MRAGPELRLSGVLSKWAEGSAHNPLIFAAVTLLLVLTSALAASFRRAVRLPSIRWTLCAI